ncbi:MAG TPA: 4'-phosphopantetheinyl transferase superfamily protein [Candidatus Dormibacteraeota bacterium]|nr:4'-phosphopantetheinyl transferase superfamily protein [Candidatus Dormibacteraeota bacterium]
MRVPPRAWPGAEEVHVWQAELDVDADEIGDLLAHLSSEERDSAGRYRDAREWARDVAARGWLRQLAGRYLGDAPAALALVTDELGRPRLDGPMGDRLRFSMSRSEGTAIYAFARDRNVGVDVERVRDGVPVDAVARRFLSETERERLAALPPRLQVRAFFECWTRKRASLKAIGVALSGVEQSTTDGAGWSLHRVDAGSSFAAALAVTGAPGIPAAATALSLNRSTQNPRLAPRSPRLMRIGTGPAAWPDSPPAPRRTLVTDTRTVQEEAPMTDQPQVSRTEPPDPIPLLPRGEVLFEGLPVAAVIMEALAPTLGHGSMVVRDRDRGAVALVREGTLVEVHAFSGTASHGGDGVLAEVQGWAGATLSAHRLGPLLVDVCEALLRGEILYSDLRLEWVEWPALLTDFKRRGGAYAVEIFTPAGRGVTCVAVGQQALSYTDIHPSLEDPALLEAMASNRDGSIRVRRLNTAAFAATAMAATGSASGVEAAAAAATSAGPLPATSLAGNGNGNGNGNATHADAEMRTEAETRTADAAPREATAAAPAATPDPSEPGPALEADDILPDLTWVAPWQTPWRDESAADRAPAAGARPSDAPALSVGEMLDDLRSIAQRRLQLSASRVETVLDEAAREQRTLDSVLEEIRSMSIRGVMPSTVDAMVAEMKIAAAEHRSV